MTQHINKEIDYTGRKYLLIGVHAGWDMFLAQEIGGDDQTLIAFAHVVRGLTPMGDAEAMQMTVTTSKDTVTTRWLIGRSYGFLIARPEASYAEEGLLELIAAVDVTHEATAEGSPEKSMRSIAKRVEREFLAQIIKSD